MAHVGGYGALPWEGLQVEAEHLCADGDFESAMRCYLEAAELAGRAFDPLAQAVFSALASYAASDAGHPDQEASDLIVVSRDLLDDLALEVHEATEAAAAFLDAGADEEALDVLLRAFDALEAGSQHYQEVASAISAIYEAYPTPEPQDAALHAIGGQQ